MENTIFLIDAYGLIYRSYFAFMKHPLTNSKGFNTSPILGFVRTIEDVLQQFEPSHIVVAFDGKVRNFRFKIYNQYKAQREKTPEDILVSIPVIMQILDAYHIQYVQLNESTYDEGDVHYSYEADDIIGTLSYKASQAGFKVYMLSADKDYIQLLRDNVFLYQPQFGGGYKTIGLDNLEESWHLTQPLQMIDYLALAGDSADNIPGCPGIGKKTAPELIQQFGSIENLLKNTEQLKGATKRKIEENIATIQLSYTLAKIHLDVPVDFDEKKFRVVEPDKNTLIQIFTDYELKSLLNKYVPQPSKKSKKVDNQPSLFDLDTTNQSEEIKSSNLSNLTTIFHNYQLIDNEEKLDEFIPKLSATDFFCFDTETTSLNVFSAQLVGMSFCWKEGESYFIIFPEDRVECLRFLEKLKPFLINKSILKIGQNLKYDFEILSQYGITVKGKIFDTMIAHYLLEPEQKHNMDFLAEIYLSYQTITYEEMSKGLNIRSVDKSVLADYGAEDADVTFRLKNVFEPLLKKNNFDDLFYNIEMPLVPVLVKMELAGVCIDIKYMSTLSNTLNAELLNIQSKIYEQADWNFNISSPRQVGELIYDRLKLVDKPKKTKTGQYSTTETILEELKSKAPVVASILDYRAYKKLISTYVDALPLLVNPITHKIHTSYNQTITATGRLSSSNPNLQNIPVRDALGKDIRKAFIPDEGNLFFSADYSQIELRVMAHLSQDENLMNAFLADVDVHADTASKIFKVPIEEVTKDMRRKAKTANFGIIYGISAFGLAQRLDIKREEAKKLIDDYFETYPKVKEYMDLSIKKAQENGYVETLLHRRRSLPDINSRNANVRGFAERNAINAPIQGTAADIIKIAMVNIMRKFEDLNLRSQMIMQVHDELNFNVYPDELEVVKKIVIDEMQGAFKLSVPLIVDCGVGANWLIAH